MRTLPACAGAMLFALLSGPAVAQGTFVVQAPVYAGSLPAPRIVMAGDVNCDGRADLLSFYPPDNGLLDAIRISSYGKPLPANRIRTSVGKEVLAIAAGRFEDRNRLSVLAMLPDGQIHLLHAADAAGAFAKDDAVITLPTSLRPKTPAHALAGDLDGSDRDDLLLIGADSRMTLVRGLVQPGEPARFEAIPIRGRLPRARRVIVGDAPGQDGPCLIWMEPGGRVRFAALKVDATQGRLSEVRTLTTALPDDMLVSGRFLGGQRRDLLIGSKLIPGGATGTDAGKRRLPISPSDEIDVQGLPECASASGDLDWIAADCDGDGKDDLIRVRRSPERFVGDDVLISYSRPGWADSSGDGLLDTWKTGELKPGGLDLKALGCLVGRREVIVEVQPTDDTPPARVRSDMEKATRYFASLPIANPDGSMGITLHVIQREAIAQADRGRSWWDLGARYHPDSHRGVTHWMVVYNGGGGQSGEMTDRGGCGVHALYATFIHEFGHQLGLPHTGFWNGWSPTYPSLMNYTYSYQLGGRAEDIGYSDGRLSGVVLNQAHLDERLPLPPEKVSFLAGPPYHFHLKPDPENGGTLIDWNWDGVFGEKDVAAAINYGYGTTAGLRHTIGKTYCAPALAAARCGREQTLVCFAGRLPEGASLPPADGNATKPGLSPDNPGRLRMRVWLGKHPARDGPKWSDEVDVERSGATGDASACTCNGVVWVAYPTAQGIALRSATLDARRKPAIGAAALVPGSEGDQATLAALGGRLVLLLWRGADKPVACRLISINHGELTMGAEQPLALTSLAPVGAAQGARERGEETLWLAASQNQDAARPSRWQIKRLGIRGDVIRIASSEWVGGEKGQERGTGRLMLLWEHDRTVGAHGRLYVLCTGSYTPQAPWQCHYVSMQIGDRTVNGGWLTRRYYDEWTQSRSAPGVCWFRGDIAFASRWMGNVHGTENDNLFVGFYGRGISAEPMGDFDDIGFIRDVGLRHSIPWVTQ